MGGGALLAITLKIYFNKSDDLESLAQEVNKIITSEVNPDHSTKLEVLSVYHTQAERHHIKDII